jgi:hypothetical protein
VAASAPKDMSWGYVIELELSLPEPAWDAWRALTLRAFPLPAAWPSEAMASYFAPAAAGDATLGDALDAGDWQGEPTIERDGGVVTVKLLATLDRSLLEVAGTAPALLCGAVQLGGSGTLLICSDGSALEPGWRIAVDDDNVTLVTEALDEDEMSEELERLSEDLGVA